MHNKPSYRWLCFVRIKCFRLLKLLRLRTKLTLYSAFLCQERAPDVMFLNMSPIPFGYLSNIIILTRSFYVKSILFSSLIRSFSIITGIAFWFMLLSVRFFPCNNHVNLTKINIDRHNLHFYRGTNGIPAGAILHI